MMFHSTSFPPSCGVFCTGCKICCDLVDKLDLAVCSRSSSTVDRAQNPNGNMQLNLDAIKQRNINVQDASPRENPAQLAGEEEMTRDVKSSEKNNARISRDFDKHHDQKRACTTCRKISTRDCREDVTCNRERYSCNHGACRTRCTNRKFHCFALCCMGRSVCYKNSISPRERHECRCTAKRCSRSRIIRRTWCCWSPM